MYKTILCILLILITIGCDNTKPIDFKNGTFVVLVDDIETTYIERNENYQLERSINESQKELFKIEWITNKKYILKSISKKKSKDLVDLLPLIVIIDSINRNSYYQTSYIEGINLKFSCKIKKIDDKVSEKFINIISQ